MSGLGHSRQTWCARTARCPEFRSGRAASISAEVMRRKLATEFLEAVVDLGRHLLGRKDEAVDVAAEADDEQPERPRSPLDTVVAA